MSHSFFIEFENPAWGPHLWRCVRCGSSIWSRNKPRPGRGKARDIEPDCDLAAVRAVTDS